MEKTAYIGPPLAELYLTIIRDANPVFMLSLDLGIPNGVPQFEIKLPLPEGKATQTAKVVREALAALLDEALAFMQSMGFSRELQVQVYAAALRCFESITAEAEAEAAVPDYAKDNVVKVYEGTFPIPQAFVNETQQRVVTAATNVKRVPEVRRIELTKLPPPKVQPNEVEKLIRMYRGRSLQNQPHRLYVMVYDQVGRPAGVLPVQNQWKNTLLKNSTMGGNGRLVTPVLGEGGKLYPKGHPVNVEPTGSHRAEVKDAETGALIVKANQRDLGLMVE